MPYTDCTCASMKSLFPSSLPVPTKMIGLLFSSASSGRIVIGCGLFDGSLATPISVASRPAGAKVSLTSKRQMLPIVSPP